MKALQLTAYNRLEMVDVPKPEPGEKEVLIKVEACGICGSDVHGVDGSTGRRLPPIIMGHEASGVIEKLGPGIKNYKVGDRVAFDSTIYCGECRYCREGSVNFCENRQVLGVSCDEFHRDGAFAEYVTVPEIVLYHMPDEVSFNQGAMLEPLAIGLHAVRITPIKIGDTALLMGAGIIGLMTLQGLKNSGCTNIYVADVDETRLELARKFGATETFDPRKVDIPAEIMKRTAGMGANISFDAVGHRIHSTRLYLQPAQGRFLYSHRQHHSDYYHAPSVCCGPPDNHYRLQRLLRRVRGGPGAYSEGYGGCGHGYVRGCTPGRGCQLV